MYRTMNGKIYKYLLHIVAWLLGIIIPMFIDDFRHISSYVPLQFYLSFALLILTFYLSNHFIKQKKFIRYLLITVLMFLSYFYVPELICKALPQNSFTKYIGTIDEVLQAKIKMGLVILYLVVWSVSIIIHANKLTENTRKLQEVKTKAELEVLKSQMNPHVFFNSLNAIYYLAMQKFDEAPNAMMRYVLIDANTEQVTLNQKQEYLNKYIAIQQLRLPEKTKLDFQFGEARFLLSGEAYSYLSAKIQN